MTISVVVTPEPGGYFFVRFKRGDNAMPHAYNTSEAFATEEEAVAHAGMLRIGGHKPVQLCYVPPYRGVPEVKIPLVIVEVWGD